MIEFLHSDAFWAMRVVQDHETMCQQAWSTKPDSRLAEAEIDELRKALSNLENAFTGIQAFQGKWAIQKLNEQLRLQRAGVGMFPSCESVYHQLTNIRESLLADVCVHRFVYIPDKRAPYMESTALFGGKVNEAFPFAIQDIKEAGNCFAAELHTACVFHLMRVAERGLRALAKHLRVTVHNTPLELSEWNAILRELEKKVEALNKTSRTHKRQHSLEFYQGAVLDIRALKDVYRNNVSHCHGSFDEGQAKSAMDHTGGLMRRLAERIYEKKDTLATKP